MSKRMQNAEGKREGHPDRDCGLGKGEKRGAGIRHKGLGWRGLRQLRWYREIRQILESQAEVTARQEPRPTGRARLQLSTIQTPVTVSLGQTSWADKVAGPAAGIFHCQIKCITVIHLIRGCAVTTCDSHDTLLERWTWGICRPAIEAKQRLNRRQQRQRSASPAIRSWIGRAIGRCRPVPVPRRSADIPVCGRWGLSSPQFATAETIAELESSANPQAGKPAPPDAT